MKNILKTFFICSVAVLILMLCSCSDEKKQNEIPNTGNSEEQESVQNSLNDAFEGSSDFPTEAKSIEYTPDEGTVQITLSDNEIKIDGSGAMADGSTLKITSQGTYLLSGTLSDGQIIVDTEDSEKVKLVLNGVNISSSQSAIYVVSAPKKVILNTVSGSVNILSDGLAYITPDEEQVDGEIYPNACIYSCDDLKFSGNGDIYITSNAGKGVNSKDDIEITSGNIHINCVDDGIRGNDSVIVSGGKITINSLADGIKSANTEDTEKGQITVSGGEINIKCATDAIQSANTLTVSGGVLNLLCADGTDTSSQSTYDQSLPGNNARWSNGFGGPGGGFGGGFGGPGGMEDGNSSKPDYSCKGLKSEKDIVISGGNITVNTPDDAIHADKSVKILGGTFSIMSGDDGIHAEEYLTIDDGKIDILSSYEGMEAIIITVNGGDISILASDDGFNACGGTTMWGESESTLEPILTFNDGNITVNASGDGIDSNGNIVMTGGTVLVYGPTNNGNGAIDFGDRNYDMTISGGTLLAVGASGMAETATGIGQGVIGLKMGNISADSSITITDSNGDAVYEFTTPKSISSIVFSSKSIVSGESYTVTVNGEKLGTINAA